MVDYDKKTDVLDAAVLDELSKELGQASTTRRACLVVVAGKELGKMVTLGTEQLLIGRAIDVDIQLGDEAVSRHHARVFPSDEGDWIVEDLGSTNGVWCNGERVTERLLQPHDKVMIGTTAVLEFTHKDELEQRFVAHQYESGVLDELTGCYNKRYFDEHLGIEFNYAVRHEHALSLVLVAVDDIEGLRETYGHRAANQLLAGLAPQMATMIRTEDLLARVADDTFALLVRETGRDAARILTERIRAQASEASVEYGGWIIRATMSIGVACFCDQLPAAAYQLREAAELALGRARAAGGDRVELAT